MPVNTSSTKFLAKLRYLLVFALVFGLIFAGGFFLNSYFQLKKIEVIGEKKDIFGLKELTGKNLLFISETSINEILIKRNPSIKTISFEKKLPSTLVLRIVFDQPIGELIVGDGFFDLAENGKIVTKSKKENAKLPKINFYQKFNYQSLSQGEIISLKEILDGLYFLKSLAEINLKVDSLDINGINMIVFNLGNRKIIFSSEKERKLQVFQVKEIIRRFKLEGKQYREIDLRFDKPVVRF